MPFPVTTFVAGVFALMLVPLSLQISMRRLEVKTMAMDAKDDLLRRRIRAFGNFAEYAPMMLIVLGLAEAAGSPTALLWPLAACFVGSRVAHAAGMLFSRGTALRGAAMVVQHVAFVLAGGWLLLRSMI
jgi:hypothetical protein